MKTASVLLQHSAAWTDFVPYSTWQLSILHETSMHSILSLWPTYHWMVNQLLCSCSVGASTLKLVGICSIKLISRHLLKLISISQSVWFILMMFIVNGKVTVDLLSRRPRGCAEPCDPSVNVLFFFLTLPYQHFHDGRKAQQHIESSWKQLESVSKPPLTCTSTISWTATFFKCRKRLITSSKLESALIPPASGYN